MAGTEYRMDGLDEWEQELARAIEEQYPEEFKAMVIQVAMELQGKVKEKTPKKTSWLQNNWKVGEVRKRGDEYVIEVYNNVEYAEAVEWGHRQKVGQYVPALGKRLKAKTVKGAHMMELSLAELQAVLPGYLQEWIDKGIVVKADTLEVKFQDKNIYDVLEMTVNQAIEFFTEHGQKKIVKKLIPLQDVGLGYIKLGQSSSTLSGGENQRVKLAYYLSQEKADPTLFIFDEPTTGLHFHDIRKLLDAFDALIRRGHTIIIIEHNMDMIKCADHIIDLGPEGGDKGGYIVATGTPEEIAACGASYTGQFLKEKLQY